MVVFFYLFSFNRNCPITHFHLFFMYIFLASGAATENKKGNILKSVFQCN